jgi:hypothetical protein
MTVGKLDAPVSELIRNQHVLEFAWRLRIALIKYNDFSSYNDIRNSSTKEKFLEAIKKFSERYRRLAQKYKLKHLTHETLEEIVNLVDKYGLKPVVDVIIIVCNTKIQKLEEEQNANSEVLEN